MFSNFFDNVYNDVVNAKSSANGFASKRDIETIINRMGYSFSRASVDKLLARNEIGEKLDDGELQNNTLGIVPSDILGKGERIRYSKKAVKEVLAYVMLTEIYTGLGKGRAMEDRLKHIAACKRAITAMKLDTFPCFKENNLTIEQRLLLGYYFIRNWIMGNYSLEVDNDLKFYSDWNLFFSKCWCVEFSSDGNRLPFYSRYQILQNYTKNSLESIQSFKGDNSDIVSTILFLDRFLNVASKEEKDILRCWMEIILCLDNKSSWITQEAKAALNKIHGLQIDRCIDDWWLISFIYLHMMKRKSELNY